MKKILSESFKRPFTVTEGLLCATTGLLLVSTFGLPKVTSTSLVILAGICIVLAITLSVLGDTERSETDVAFFWISSAVCLLLAVLLGVNPVIRLIGAAAIMNGVYGIYNIMLSFMTEPPDSMCLRKNGIVRIAVSAAMIMICAIVMIITC